MLAIPTPLRKTTAATTTADTTTITAGLYRLNRSGTPTWQEPAWMQLLSSLTNPEQRTAVPIPPRKATTATAATTIKAT